ncbi:MAG: hypothetical protein II037_10195, partial [Bacteroidales bacterium]|nr:hypothetical protein [Bacteroidales bacterium]
MKTTISIIIAVLISVSMSAIDPVKIYKGTSVYSSDVVCNIRDGKIYKANSVYSSDVIFTIRDGKVYSGNSVYTS